MKELLIFDYETTSNKPESTRGVQLAAVSYPIVDGNIDFDHGTVVLNTLCNPGVDIHHEAAEIHGITTEMVQGFPADTHFSAQLYDYIAERHAKREIILGFQNGCTFDLPILMRLAKMHSDGKVREFIPSIPYIDTLIAATRTLPHAKSHRLSLPTPEEQAKHGGPGLVQLFGLDSGEGAHDAAVDCKLVMLLIREFMAQLMPNIRNELQKLRDEGKLVLEDHEFANDTYLFALWCARPRILTVCHFGKNKGKLWGKPPEGASKEERAKYVNGSIIWWICENFDPTPDLAATIRHFYGRKFKKPMRC